MNTEPFPFYNHIKTFSESRQALFVAFLWGLAEATIFFLVPDILLGLVVLFSWRKGLMSTVFTLAGAMIGGAIMYTLAYNNTAAMNQVLMSIPLINRNMVNTVMEQMKQNGLRALVMGPLQGIPYKIYAVQAGIQRLPFIPFLFFTIPARLERILPVVLLGGVIGVAFKKFIQRHASLVTSTYFGVWVCIYMLYYLRFR
jgi:membrane protein YqaA with SNARE-associated domain